jgi:hypothetical protein
MEAISNNDGEQMDTVFIKNSLRDWTVEMMPKSGLWFFRSEFPRGYVVTPTIYHFFNSVNEAISIAWYWKNWRRYMVPTEVPTLENAILYEYDKMTGNWIEQVPITPTADLMVHVHFPGDRQRGGYVFLFEKRT